ncbi:unnamed protein product [Nyctereutes procyonoides]|uniref:(raccoon dog) hypothetical protein n=1 Tax=Nyctereutes procyonoides TaxID=34880 RepID=A0A811Z201_NYCPR|nr:unnamed protein product [Nyctereutes procyonoides]
MSQFVCNLMEKALVLMNAVELVPPSPAEISTAICSLKKRVKSSFKWLMVKEAQPNGLVATEVWMWFYVGKIINKQAWNHWLKCLKTNL